MCEWAQSMKPADHERGAIGIAKGRREGKRSCVCCVSGNEVPECERAQRKEKGWGMRD